MARPLIGDRAITPAERQRRHRQQQQGSAADFSRIFQLDNPKLHEATLRGLAAIPLKYQRRVIGLMFAATELSEKDRALFFRMVTYTESRGGCANKRVGFRPIRLPS